MGKVKLISLLHSMGRLMVGVTALFFVSCAEDGYDDDERFDSGVHNTQLTAIPADSIDVEASADGSKTVISWPVVYGAVGYRVSVYNVTDADNVVVLDSVQGTVVDGCSLAVSREEDNFYRFVIQVLGDESKGNTDASDSTSLAFNSFAVSLDTIPSGTDLIEYFNSNPIPESSSMVYYDLEEGGSYTLSSTLDFAGSQVCLRCKNSANRPTITMTAAESSFSTASPMRLQNLIVDCTASESPVIQFPEEVPSNVTMQSGSQYYNILGTMKLDGCYFKGVQSYFMYDNQVKYCLETFLMDNCVVQCNSSSDIASGAYFYLTKASFIKDLYIQNSSWYNTSDVSVKYFVQYNGSGRLDRAGYDTSVGQSFNYINCSFYNMCKTGQWGNYNGFAGRNYTYIDVENNIWVDCGNGQVMRRLLGGRNASSYSKKYVCNNNTYWYNGAAETGNTSYDTGYQLQTDPAFVDPMNGDLTPTGAEQVSLKTGDPRWFE
jgi:hypothetical protein